MNTSADIIPKSFRMPVLETPSAVNRMLETEIANYRLREQIAKEANDKMQARIEDVTGLLQEVGELAIKALDAWKELAPYGIEHPYPEGKKLWEDEQELRKLIAEGSEKPCRLRTELSARDALCAELREALRYRLSYNPHIEDDTKHRALLSKTPESMGAELARLRVIERDHQETWALFGPIVLTDALVSTVGYALSERDALRARIAEQDAELVQHRKDLADGAGELLLPLPEPGTPMAKMMAANRIMRGQRDDLRSRVAELEGYLKCEKDRADAGWARVLPAESQLAGLIAAGDQMEICICELRGSSAMASGAPTADEAIAAWDAAKSGISTTGLPVVAGRNTSTSNADFERACLVHIERLQHGLGDYDGAMLGTFAEAVRLVREYSDAMNGNELAALREDRERLDWLESNGKPKGIFFSKGDGGWIHDGTDEVEEAFLRECIDAARNEGGK